MRRLKLLGLKTIEVRRFKNDLIKAYKIIFNDYGGLATDLFDFPAVESITSSNGLKLKIGDSELKLESRKHFFNNRIVDIWNRLSRETVLAPNLRSFKKRLNSEKSSIFSSSP